MYDSGDIKENKGTGEWECVHEVYGGKSWEKVRAVMRA